jgi:hypothetical protein
MWAMVLAPRVHRRDGRPQLGQVQQPTPNQREVVSMAFAIDCHDREVPAWTASPQPLTAEDFGL